MNKILIAHRGNVFTQSRVRENTIDYLHEAINCGFDVECDIFWQDNKFWFGHDAPSILVEDPYFLVDPRVWVHCKNIITLYHYERFSSTQSKNPYPHFFFHQEDNCTLTSNKFIWTYPGMPLTPMSIAVKPEGLYSKKELEGCAGICSDFISRYIND